MAAIKSGMKPIDTGLRLTCMNPNCYDDSSVFATTATPVRDCRSGKRCSPSQDFASSLPEDRMDIFVPKLYQETCLKMPKRGAYIRSVGHFVPERRLTNQDLKLMLDVDDEWIVSRTGIRERRILEPGLGNSYMATRAARECLERAGVGAEELDVIIIGTITPDMLIPSTAALVQKEIGAVNAWGFDLSAGCSGFIFALTTGSQLIETGKYKKVLVIGSDVQSCFSDYTDPNTCVLFGDAAGAVLLEACPEPDYGIIDSVQHMDGGGAGLLSVKAGGSRRPASIETVQNKEHFIWQDGRQVFKRAVTEMAAISAHILEKNGLTGNDVSLFIPHQANIRIVEACAAKMGIDPGKVMINIDRFANTCCGTISLCLYQAVAEENRLQKGDYLVLSAFGGGFTWGSVLLRWWDDGTSVVARNGDSDRREVA
jgi:3-oxoacyl-[acyl-carrier-protein] synthase III